MRCRFALACCCLLVALLWQPVWALDVVDADTEDGLIREIATVIAEHARQRGLDMQVDNTGYWLQKRPFTPGRFAVRMRAVPEPAGSERIDVAIFDASGDGGAGASTGRARFAARRFQWAWVARRPMTALQGMAACDPNAFERTRRVVRGPQALGAWDGPCTDLGGLELRRPLMPGDVLMVGDMRHPPLVRERSVVQARVVAGAVEIQVEALALQDGSEGDKVLIKVPGRVAAVKATVFAAGHVLLD